jgi:hypothetical protein
MKHRSRDVIVDFEQILSSLGRRWEVRGGLIGA